MLLLRQPGAVAPYQQIREILRKEILDRMAVGDRIPPERDLAARFSANRATVSRAINCLVNEGLLVRHVPRGTFVAGDWNLSRVRTRAVAMVVPEIERPFPSGALKSAARQLRRQGYSPLLFDSDTSAATEKDELERLTQEGLEGALVLPVAPRDNLPIFERLVRLGYPLVFLDHKPPDLDADCVATDHFRGAYEATRVLIERGHRRIAHFTYLGPGLHASILDRRQGYEQALADHGIDPDPDLVLAPIVSAQTGKPYEYRHALYYLRYHGEPVTAVFALNDLFAISTVVAARELGLQVPDEVEVAAYFDSGLGPIADMPPMIMVVQRQHEIGGAAANLLVSRMEKTGPDTPQTIKVEPDVVDRLPEPLCIAHQSRHDART